LALYGFIFHRQRRPLQQPARVRQRCPLVDVSPVGTERGSLDVVIEQYGAVKVVLWIVEAEVVEEFEFLGVPCLVFSLSFVAMFTFLFLVQSVRGLSAFH
jgi:hypothetical protein